MAPRNAGGATAADALSALVAKLTDKKAQVLDPGLLSNLKLRCKASGGRDLGVQTNASRRAHDLAAACSSRPRPCVTPPARTPSDATLLEVFELLWDRLSSSNAQVCHA